MTVSSCIMDLPSPIEAVIHIEQPDRKLREEDM